MIIEDNEADTFICRKLFELQGLKPKITSVQTAPEGIDFLNKCEMKPEKLPDVVILDIFLPGENGFYFLDKIASFSNTCCRVVVVTAADDTALREKAFSYPFVRAYIAKPLDRNSLQMLMDTMAEA